MGTSPTIMLVDSSQIIHEPESVTREMTNEEKANRPNITLDLAQRKQQHKGPDMDMVVEEFQSL
jgi:hypothetical protein